MNSTIDLSSGIERGGIGEAMDIYSSEFADAKPLVSVVMLSYKHENFIAQAIDSVISQKAPFHFEILIAEDCSHDRSADIALDFRARHPERIRVVRNVINLGMQANFRRAISLCRGEYIAFCESDDYWSDESKLEVQVGVMQRYPQCALSFHPASTLDVESGRQVTTARWAPWSRFMDAREVVLGDGGFMPTASIMIRRDPVIVSGGDWMYEAVVPDYAIALWASHSGSVAYIDRNMSVYRANVPASWTKRHAADFSYRFRHARAVDEMLQKFSAQSGGLLGREIAHMVSKYYSDVFVRFSSSRREMSLAWPWADPRMKGSDRFMAYLAMRYGIKLPAVKSVIRACGTALRLLGYLFSQPRLRI